MSGNINLKPLWAELISIYESFRKVCEKNGLRFYAAAGTALGAVRHKGFIPWDDDLDLFMPRKDYEQFLDIAGVELPTHLQVVCQRTMTSYPFMFGKVIDTRKSIVEKVHAESGHPLSEGLYIDIFPLDGMRIPNVFSRICSSFLRVRKGLLSHAPTATFNAKVGRVLAWGTIFCPEPWSLRRANELNYRRATSIPFDAAEHVGFYDGSICAFQRVATYRRKWFDSTSWIPFEQTQMPVPKGVHEMLTCHFGDYMQLPPIEHRIFKHSFNPPVPWRYGPVN